MNANPWARAPALVAILMRWGSAGAAETGPILPLPFADKLAIENSLGRGTVGKPVAAPVIADPSRYLAFAAGTWTYRVLKGPHGKTSERYEWSADPAGSEGARWRYDAGGEEIGYVEGRADGDFFLTGVREIRDNALTRYAPPEPLLLKGLVPGQELRLRMEVKVYDPDDQAEPVHEGALDVTYRYIGAYRLDLPIGARDAVLLKSTFSGKIGPAVLNDVQYRFFSLGVGMVALMERREVSAFYVYNLHMDVAKVLADRPK